MAGAVAKNSQRTLHLGLVCFTPQRSHTQKCMLQRERLAVEARGESRHPFIQCRRLAFTHEGLMRRPLGPARGTTTRGTSTDGGQRGSHVLFITAGQHAPLELLNKHITNLINDPLPRRGAPMKLHACRLKEAQYPSASSETTETKSARRQRELTRHKFYLVLGRARHRCAVAKIKKTNHLTSCFTHCSRAAVLHAVFDTTYNGTRLSVRILGKSSKKPDAERRLLPPNAGTGTLIASASSEPEAKNFNNLRPVQRLRCHAFPSPHTDLFRAASRQTQR